MSHSDLVNSFKKVTSITDKSILSIVRDKEIADILISRKNYLKNVLAEMEKTPYNGNSLADYFKKIDSKIDIPKKEYDDVVQKMIAQRKNIINTVNDGFPLEVTLSNIKDNYLAENRYIRSKIMKASCYSSYLEAETQRLDKLIEQGYIPRDIVLYRGATPYDFGLSHISSQEFIKKFYKKGRLFKIPIYPETSLDKEIGKSFAKNRILFKINVPKGTQGIYMENLGLPKTGYFGNEEEVLLPRDLVYKFKSHTQENGYDLIELDIVRSKPFWKKIHEFWAEL